MAQNPTNDSNNANEDYSVTVSVNRVAKVVKGGRRFGFSAVVVVGDRKGRVGYGLGKAKEVAEARTKAEHAAKKAMIRIGLKDQRTIHHDVKACFGAGKVMLRAAPVGTGIIAGGPMRQIFELAGIHDIVAKSIGSSNVHNMVGATFEALKNLTSPRMVAERRNKKVSAILDKNDKHQVETN